MICVYAAVCWKLPNPSAIVFILLNGEKCIFSFSILAFLNALISNKSTTLKIDRNRLLKGTDKTLFGCKTNILQ